MYDFLWNNKCDSSEYIYLNAYYCVLFSRRVRIRFSVWLLNVYAHVCIRLFCCHCTILLTCQLANFCTMPSVPLHLLASWYYAYLLLLLLLLLSCHSCMWCAVCGSPEPIRRGATSESSASVDQSGTPRNRHDGFHQGLGAAGTLEGTQRARCCQFCFFFCLLHTARTGPGNFYSWTWVPKELWNPWIMLASSRKTKLLSRISNFFLIFPRLHQN